MAKEVFGGQVGDAKLYDLGVRAGALGLLLQSVVLGFMSLGVEFLGKKIGGAKRLWGILNFVLAICLAMTILVTKMAEKSRRHDAAGTLMGPTPGVKIGALLLFAALGIPLAVSFFPFIITINKILDSQLTELIKYFFTKNLIFIFSMCEHILQVG